jgi:4-hydroxy-tetrahydrodipicolinate reductase
MGIKVCLAGATGWAGSELARAIGNAADIDLVAAVSRTHAGRLLGEVLGEPRLSCPVYASAIDALARPYVDGALLAIRKVSTLIGVHRGLDAVLDL